jgi:hypothetical protein
MRTSRTPSQHAPSFVHLRCATINYIDTGNLSFLEGALTFKQDNHDRRPPVGVVTQRFPQDDNIELFGLERVPGMKNLRIDVHTGRRQAYNGKYKYRLFVCIEASIRDGLDRVLLLQGLPHEPPVPSFTIKLSWPSDLEGGLPDWTSTAAIIRHAVGAACDSHGQYATLLPPVLGGPTITVEDDGRLLGEVEFY